MPSNKVSVKNLLKCIEHDISKCLEQNLFEPNKETFKKYADQYIKSFEEFSGCKATNINITDDGELTFDSKLRHIKIPVKIDNPEKYDDLFK